MRSGLDKALIIIFFLFIANMSAFAVEAIPQKTENATDSVTPDDQTNSTVSPPIPDEPPTHSTNSQDPFECINRVFFKFNDIMDTYILKPVCEVYDKIIPKPLAKGFTNFFNNIDTVPTILNDLLQGNFYQATSDTWRLAFNSTVGLLGFIDVASCIGLEPNSEDFGLTMAQWGWKDSYYIVVPFFGPSTIRDAAGWPVNYYFLSVYPYIRSANDRYKLYLLSLIVRRSELLHYESLLQQVAIDKYVFMRDAYLQHRNYLIDRNKELGDPYLSNNNKFEENEKPVAETTA